MTSHTIVVYTSDHGEMMGAHGLKPRHVAQPVSHADLVPTVLDLLGRKNAGLPGRSLLPILKGETRRDNDVFLEWTADNSDSGAGPNGRTVVSPDGYKLVLYDSDRSMLFDRNKDPQELNNVYGKPEYAAVQAKLRKRIEQWQAEAGDTMLLPG